MTDEERKMRLIVRPRFLRKSLVVLQVGVMRPYNYDPVVDIMPGGYTLEWRDATAEDLTQHWETKHD